MYTIIESHSYKSKGVFGSPPRPPTPQFHCQDPFAGFFRAIRERAKRSATQLLARTRSQPQAREIALCSPFSWKVVAGSQPNSMGKLWMGYRPGGSLVEWSELFDSGIASLFEPVRSLTSGWQQGVNLGQLSLLQIPGAGNCSLLNST